VVGAECQILLALDSLLISCLDNRLRGKSFERDAFGCLSSTAISRPIEKSARHGRYKKMSSQGVGVHRDTKLLIKTEEYQFFQRVKTITIRRVSPRHLDHATIRPLEEKCVHNEGCFLQGKIRDLPRCSARPRVNAENECRTGHACTRRNRYRWICDRLRIVDSAFGLEFALRRHSGQTKSSIRRMKTAILQPAIGC
jgi:hypothetical protein